MTLFMIGKTISNFLVQTCYLLLTEGSTRWRDRSPIGGDPYTLSPVNPRTEKQNNRPPIGARVGVLVSLYIMNIFSSPIFAKTLPPVPTEGRVQAEARRCGSNFIDKSVPRRWRTVTVRTVTWPVFSACPVPVNDGSATAVRIYWSVGRVWRTPVDTSAKLQVCAVWVPFICNWRQLQATSIHNWRKL